MNFEDSIANIVKGAEIRKDSLLLLNFWGENKDLAILDKFTLEVAKQGGVPIRWQQSKELMKDLFSKVSKEHLNFPDEYFEVFKRCDSVIDIFMYGPEPHKDFPKERIPHYGAYMRKLFGALSEGKELFIQVKVPTEENAKRASVDIEVYKEAMDNALRVDYKRLKSECTRLVSRLQDKKKVYIYSGGNNLLTLHLGERSWHKDDGTGDIPCGEVFVAPIEESAEGKILIPTVPLKEATLHNVLLEFKAGKLVGSSSKELMDYIDQFPGDKDILAEFGIGLNGSIKDLVGYSAIDEKCKGTAHIAIGMNNMFGGKNASQLHMDFIFTPDKIEVDGECLMDGQELLFLN